MRAPLRRSPLHLVLCLGLLSCSSLALAALECRPYWLQVLGFGPGVTLADVLADLGDTIGPAFSGTTPGLRVDPDLRARIRNLLPDLLEQSRIAAYHNQPVCLTTNECIGAARAFQKVLAARLNLATKIAEYRPRDHDEGGMNHVVLIVEKYFGPNSPLIIDAALKQFMSRKYWSRNHDIFVGSPDEYFTYFLENRIHRPGDTPVETFHRMMRAVITSRYDRVPSKP